jgi:hypothetical protein
MIVFNSVGKIKIFRKSSLKKFVYLRKFLKNDCMRGFFLFLIACTVSSSAMYAQNKVQDTFYGIRLGTSYKDVCSSDFVKENHPDWRHLRKCRQADFTIRDVRLGGNDWNYCDFNFVKNNSILYKLRFYHPYKDGQVAEGVYDRMLEKLDKKYEGKAGIVRKAQDSWDKDKKEWVSYTDKDGGVCCLERAYKSSTSGVMYNYVFLYYYNEDLKIKAEHSYLEEL